VDFPVLAGGCAGRVLGLRLPVGPKARRWRRSRSVSSDRRTAGLEGAMQPSSARTSGRANSRYSRRHAGSDSERQMLSA
jgi:hypothetical protein